jgi:peptidoglycan hydrolase CwlO-like protein
MIIEKLRLEFTRSSESFVLIQTKIQQKLHGIEKERDDLRKELQDTKAKLDIEIQSHTHDSTTLKNSLHTLEDHEKQTISELTKQVQALTDKLNARNTEYNEAIQKLSTTHKEEIVKIQTELMTQITKEREISAKTNTTLQSITAELNDAKKRLEDLKKELLALGDKLKLSEEEKNRMQTELKSQQSQKEIHVMTIQKDHTERITKLTKDSEVNLNQEKEKTAKQISDLLAQIQVKTAEIAKLTEERNDLKKTIEQLNTTITNLKTNITELTTKITERDIKITTLTTEIKTRNDERDELKRQITVANTKLDDETKHNAEEINRMTREMEALKEKYTLIVSEYEKYKVDQQKIITTLRTEVETLKKTVAEKDNAMTQVQTKLQELERKNSQISVYAQEIHMYTEGYCFHRLYQGITVGVPFTIEAEVKILNQYLDFGKGKQLTLKGFLEFFSKTEFMQGVSMNLLNRLFSQGTHEFIGYIQVLAAYKDMYSLQESFRTLSDGVTIKRESLKKLFRQGNLGFVDDKKTFDALFGIIDHSNDDQVSDKEFMALGLMLCVFRLLFNTTDTNQNGRLTFEEIKQMLIKYSTEADLHTKLQVNLDLFVKQEERQVYRKETNMELKNQMAAKMELPYDRFVGLVMHSVHDE